MKSVPKSPPPVARRPGRGRTGRDALLAMLLAVALSGCGRADQPSSSEAAAAASDAAALAQRTQWFGAAVAAERDITWRPSGLGIRIIRPGSGASPTPFDRVRVEYAGRLKDGTGFDATHGQPADFTVHQLIPGWAAAMSELKPGGRAEIFIPPQLGYGDLAVGRIPPSSGLIFDVTLIAVNPPG